MTAQARSSEPQSQEAGGEEHVGKGTLSGNVDSLVRLFDAIGTLALVLGPDGRIVQFNEKCEEVTGYSAAEVRGKNLIELLIPPEEQDEVREVLAGRSGGEAPRSHENHWVRKAGGRRLIRWSSTTVREEEDQTGHVILGGIDVTEQRRIKRKLVDARSKERLRIGSELHDVLGPKLTGTAMMAEALARKLEDDHPEAAGEARTMSELVQEASEEVRTLSHSLVSLNVKEGNLPGGLRELAQRQEQMKGVTCTFEKSGPIPELDEETATHLYRIASEAVSNAAEHADPEEIAIRLTTEGERLVLAVEDDGTGIPEEIGPGERATSEGAGLHLMETHADLVGAVLEVGPAEEGGTLVRCSLPLEALPEPSE